MPSADAAGMKKRIIMSQQEYNFSDIAPYEDSEFHSKMEQLVKEPGFLHAVNYTMPPKDVLSVD